MRTEREIIEMLRHEAENAPDVWHGIERSIENMEKVKTISYRRLWTGVAAAAAVVAVAAAVILTVHFTSPLTPAAPSAANNVAEVSEPPVTPALSPVPSSSAVQVVDSGEVRAPTPFYEGQDKTMLQGPNMDIPFYEKLGDMVKKKGVIAVHAKLIKTLGSAPEEGGDPNRVYTTYEMQVVKPLTGKLKAGDSFKVKTAGGASEDVWLEDNYVEKFTDAFEYVLFITKTEGEVYYLATPLQGYVPIRGGKVSLNTKIADNGLFTQSETLDELYAALEKAAK